jgi:putative chitinase
MKIELGSRGNDVVNLQKNLNLTADGVFGPKTLKTVKEWQLKNNLNPDGIITSANKSWNLMFNLVVEDVVLPVVPNLNIDKLKGHIPDFVLNQIPEVAQKFNITTNLRLVHFLSQCAHESGNWKFVNEIASGKAYEGRKDLGNVNPGDGVKYKGKGYIQLTGRANYEKFSKFIGEDCVSNPDLVATKYPLASAGFFFNSNNLWKTCDLGSTDDVVKKVTKRVNGGYNGLADRLKHFKKYHDLVIG